MTKPSEFADEGYPYTWQMIDESKRHNLLGGAKLDYHGPVYIYIGDDDDVIPVGHAKLAAKVFASDKVRLEIISGGDHRLSTPEDITRLSNLLVDILKH